MDCFEQSKNNCFFNQEFDYNKILNEIYPLSKTQVRFFKNPRGYKKGVILGSWSKLIQTNGKGWILRMTGKTEDEIEFSNSISEIKVPDFISKPVGDYF